MTREDKPAVSKSSDQQREAARPGDASDAPPSHIPPDLAKADVGRAKDLAKDLLEADAAHPAEPIMQMREGRRRKRTPKH